MRTLPLVEVPARFYEFDREYGRGGIGVVVRARDRRLDRTVALKQLTKHGQRAKQRFEREMRVAAKLQHPGVVPVHEAGRFPDGTAFYSMKLVEGDTLGELEMGRRSLTSRLELLPHLLAVADAVAYAHSEGVIHRDLKPSNVIVGAFGETVVIDWGLAKELDDEENDRDAGSDVAPIEPADRQANVATDGLTVQGQVMGTPSYMAPEQARGESAGPAADVYALGAMAFELLSGDPPHVQLDTAAKIAALRESVSPFESIDPRLRKQAPELFAIVCKAMSPEPKARYEDAGAFATDLRRLITGHLVGAHDYSLLARLRKWTARHRALVLVAGVAAVLLLGLGLMSTARIVGERDRAERERARAESERDRAERERNRVILTHARDSLATDPTNTVAWLARLPRDPSFAAITRTLASDAASRGVASRVRSVSRKPLGLLAASANGETVVIATRNGEFRVYRPSEADRTGPWGGAPVAELRGSTSAEIVVAADGSAVAIPLDDGDVFVWRHGAESTTLRGHTREVFNTAFVRDGRGLVSAGLDGDVRIGDLTNARSAVLHRHDAIVRYLAVSPDGDRVATASDDGTIALFDLAADDSSADVLSSDSRILSPPNSRGGAAALAFLGDGKLVSGHPDATLVLWSSSGERVRMVKVHEGPIDTLRAHGGTVVSLAKDGAIARIDFPDHKVTNLGGHNQPIRDTAIGRVAGSVAFVAAFADGTIRFWDLNAGFARTLRGHVGPASAVAFARDDGDDALFSVGWDGSLRVWPIVRLRPRRHHHHDQGVLALTVSPDGRYFATAGRDARVVVASGDGVEFELIGHRALVYVLEFSPDGSLLASSGWDREVRIWSVADGSLIATRTLESRPGGVEFAGSDAIWIADGKNVIEWRFLDGSHRSLGPIGPLDASGRSIRTLYRHPRGGPLVVTGAKRWMTVSRQNPRTSRWEPAVQRVLRVFGHRYVLAVADPDESRRVIVEDLASSERVGPLELPFEVAQSTMDLRRRIVYLFDGTGRGIAWRLSNNRFDRMVGPNRSPHGLTVLSDGAVALTFADGALERWDFDNHEVLVARGPEGTSRLIATMPGNALISTTDDGVVWLWPQDVLERHWAEHRALNVEHLTDMTVDESTL